MLIESLLWRGFADVIKFFFAVIIVYYNHQFVNKQLMVMHQLTLKQGGYYGLLTWVPYQQMNPEKQERKAEKSERCRDRGGWGRDANRNISGRLQSWEEVNPLWLALKIKGPQSKECEQLPEAVNDSQTTARKEMRASVLKQHGLNSAKNLTVSSRGMPPKSLQTSEVPRLVNTLISALWDPE